MGRAPISLSSNDDFIDHHQFPNTLAAHHAFAVTPVRRKKKRISTSLFSKITSSANSYLKSENILIWMKQRTFKFYINYVVDDKADIPEWSQRMNLVDSILIVYAFFFY